MEGLGIMEITMLRFRIPQVVERKLRKGNLQKPKYMKWNSTSCIPQSCKFAQRRISSWKLSFLIEVLDRSDHSGHYHSGQSTLQLSSKCIEGKTYIDAYNCSYSKEQCINSTQQHVHHIISINL